jgi:hypothetical protein
MRGGPGFRVVEGRAASAKNVVLFGLRFPVTPHLCRIEAPGEVTLGPPQKLAWVVVQWEIQRKRPISTAEGEWLAFIRLPIDLPVATPATPHGHQATAFNPL